MQERNSNTRSPGAVNHPDAAEWMSFLYREMPARRRRELDEHLTRCPACAADVKTWRESMVALDDWTMPSPGSVKRGWQPLLKWAAAAALVLFLGFSVGRSTATSQNEVAALKKSVAQLSETMERERLSNAHYTTEAITSATEATVALLSQHAKSQEMQRTEDRQTMAAALRAMELRLSQLRTELETVAVNTQDGFQQTRAGLTRLALAATETQSSNTVQ